MPVIVCRGSKFSTCGSGPAKTLVPSARNSKSFDVGAIWLDFFFIPLQLKGRAWEQRCAVETG